MGLINHLNKHKVVSINKCKSITVLTKVKKKKVTKIKLYLIYIYI